MAGPGPALVLVDTEEFPDLFGKADPLEGAHVLARRGHERAVDVGVDVHDRVDHVVGLGELGLQQPLLGDVQEVSPQDGLVLDAADGLGGDGLVHDHPEMLLEVVLGVGLGRVVVVEQMEAVKMRQLGVDAVAGETAAQAVAPVVHGGHAAQGQLTAHAGARLVAHAHEPAAAQQALLGLLAVGGTGSELPPRRVAAAGGGPRAGSDEVHPLTTPPPQPARTVFQSSVPPSGRGGSPSFSLTAARPLPSVPLARKAS